MSVRLCRPSAEPLFVSVAEVYKQNAIAVVLAGGDGDGSFGGQIIKGKEGMVIEQDRRCGLHSAVGQDRINVGRFGLDRQSSKEWSVDSQK